MPENENIVQCYNRGCGKQFDITKNDKDECCHHPGAPIFHDAYKGWSCCKKKSVDFTEFLNIKGCTFSKHSNKKPAEPEKKGLAQELQKKDIIIVRNPMMGGPRIRRPDFNGPMITIQPLVINSVRLTAQKAAVDLIAAAKGIVALGTSCTNNGCRAEYAGPESNNSLCAYHPGFPIFHEGLKYWSCCEKRTTDFNTFLHQPGCTTGPHKWIRERQPLDTANCRWDWHQTADYIVVSIYAKKYEPDQSYIKINPIRLSVQLVFWTPGEPNFILDLELRHLIILGESSATMLPSKVEIKLKKAEPGRWNKLEHPKPKASTSGAAQSSDDEDDEEEDDSVDLSAVEAVRQINMSN